MTRKIALLLTPILFLGSARSDLAAQPKPEKPAAPKTTPTSKYVRLLQDEDKEPVALQTATVRFTSAAKGGVTVDLVGVVHIGDQTYYKKLNKQLAQYDVVLFELVAPPNTVIPKGGKKRDSSNPLAFVQTAMKAVLGLESQLEQIDYTRKNFVHADLSPEQMAEAIRKRGDTPLTLTLSIAADLLRQQNLQDMKKKDAKPGAKAEPEPDLLAMLLDPDSGVKLKRVLAEQLAGSATDSGLGPTINTILISDRNAAAIGVMQKEMAKGTKKIAIFYGAAHMPDFERRLRDDFGLRPENPQWLDAWDLRFRPRGGLEDLLKELLK